MALSGWIKIREGKGEVGVLYQLGPSLPQHPPFWCRSTT